MNKKEIKERYKFLSEKISKGQSVGLTINDYIEIKNLQREINPVYVRDDEEWSSFYYELESLKTAIYNEGLFNKFSISNIDYIKSNSMILPLVLANDKNNQKIKMRGDNGYLFKCQFHEEKTPSMLVKDFKNSLYCYGCGTYKDILAYLQAYENLSYKDAIQLLAQVYLYNVDSIDKKLISLVKKYQKSLLSSRYLELLEVGYERVKERYGEYYKELNVDEIYNKRYKTIKRV